MLIEAYADFEKWWFAQGQFMVPVEAEKDPRMMSVCKDFAKVIISQMGMHQKMVYGQIEDNLTAALRHIP